MINKKILASVLMITLSGYNVCYAGFKQTGDKTVALSDTAAGEDKKVTINVLKAEKTLDDFYKAEKKDYTNILVWHDEFLCDDEGKYEISFNIENESGLYTAYINDGGDKIKTESFFYCNEEARQEKMKLLKDIEEKDAFLEFAEENQYALGFYNQLLSEIEYDDVMNIVYSYMQENDIDETDREKATEIFYKAMLAQLLNKQKIDNIFEYSYEMNLEESSIKDFLNKDYVNENLQKDVTKRMSGNKIDSIEEFEDELEEAFILSSIENPDGYGNVKQLITKFSDEIGISNPTDNDAVYKKLAGNYYSDFSALASAYKSALRTVNGSTEGSGGGSGSGSNKNNSYNGSYVIGSSSENQIPAEKPADIFYDIEDASWAREAIVGLAERQIINGKGNYFFCPNDNITREEFAKIIVGAFFENAEGKDVFFNDVSKEAWYYEPISKAYALGIVNGISNDIFGVGQNITRQDMALMSYRAAVAAGKAFDRNESKFGDDYLISDYASEAVYALAGSNVINGIDGENFAPQGYATRAQAAKIIYLLLNL